MEQGCGDGELKPLYGYCKYKRKDCLFQLLLVDKSYLLYYGNGNENDYHKKSICMDEIAHVSCSPAFGGGSGGEITFYTFTDKKFKLFPLKQKLFEKWSIDAPAWLLYIRNNNMNNNNILYSMWQISLHYKESFEPISTCYKKCPIADSSGNWWDGPLVLKLSASTLTLIRQNTQQFDPIAESPLKQAIEQRLFHVGRVLFIGHWQLLFETIALALKWKKALLEDESVVLEEPEEGEMETVEFQISLLGGGDKLNNLDLIKEAREKQRVKQRERRRSLGTDEEWE
jgi:hypothetical protein